MKLTPEQRLAVEHDGNTLLMACPGSGKTRAIVAKMLRFVPEVRDTARRIACITYTNAAVHEIEARLRTLGEMDDEDYFDVSTIHTFCLNHILRPFCWRVDAYRDGFQVAAPDTDRYVEIVKAVQATHRLRPKTHECFSQLNRMADGTPVVPDELTAEIALDFWGRLRAEGLLDFSTIVFESYQLLRQHPRIAEGLACKFTWFLVDEFQDTTALQVNIFSLIAASTKTRFFLVGDPAQSIYAFAGADPSVSAAFTASIKARDDFRLTQNFRCGQPIIRHAERLWPRHPPMVAAGAAALINEEPRYRHASTAFAAITEEFLPWLEEKGIAFGDAAVLAPWWTKLYPLGCQLRESGVQIVGPGARPYRRSRLFAPIAESVCGYLERPSAALIPQIERDIFNLVSELTGRAPFHVFSYAGRTTVYRLIRAAAEAREAHERAVDWLQMASERFAGVLVSDEWIPPALSALLRESADDIYRDMAGRKEVDLENFAVSDLGLFACPSESLKLITMHASKGREFEAVALIDLHDGRVPDFRRFDTPEGVEDGRRLLYVAATRARRALLYVTDSENWRSRPSRFLKAGELELA